jgi:hypothetical protein
LASFEYVPGPRSALGSNCGHHLHGAGARVQRDDGALATRQRLEGDALGLRVQRRRHGVAGLPVAAQLVDHRRQLVALPGQVVVAVLLQARPAERRERIADRMAEQPAGRVAARVDPAALLDRAREHGAVVGADRAAVDALLLEQRALVERVVAQRRRIEDRVARREVHEHREQHQHERVEPPDRSVHSGSRLALSDTSSSSASSTKFAMIDEPP